LSESVSKSISSSTFLACLKKLCHCCKDKPVMSKEKTALQKCQITWIITAKLVAVHLPPYHPPVAFVFKLTSVLFDSP
jgi:hypothetical protein